ncbi:MAG: hypothetical protein JWL77_2372 [Chthonomonadaceae bacterium]|nr:hypothetical protein [Chthonomonadaceae bacterium]
MTTVTEIDLPTDIQSALNTNEAARSRFAQLPLSHQNEYLKHINEAKKPETRARRIESMLSRLSE